MRHPIQLELVEFCESFYNIVYENEFQNPQTSSRAIYFSNAHCSRFESPLKSPAAPGTLLKKSRNLSFSCRSSSCCVQQIFGFLGLLSNYCVAIPFLKLMMVPSADRCLHVTRKSEQRTSCNSTTLK
jgi:hypothetical protein